MNLLFALVFLAASLPAAAQLGGLPRLPTLPATPDLLVKRLLNT